MPQKQTFDDVQPIQQTFDDVQPVEQPGMLNRLVTSVAGVPEGTDLTDTSGMGKLASWIEAIKQAVKGLNPVPGFTDASKTANSRLAQPGIINKLVGAVEQQVARVPYAGPNAVDAMEKASKGDYAGSLGSAINVSLPAIIPAIENLPEKFRASMQSATGVGPTATALAEENRTSQIQKAAGEHAQASSDVQKNNVRKVSEAKNNYLRTQAAVQQREALLQQAEQARNTVAQQLPVAREQARAVASSLYPEIEGTTDPAQLQKGIQGAVDKNLRGSEKVPGVISRIMSEISPDKPVATARALTPKELEMTKAIQNDKTGNFANLSTQELRQALPNLGFVPKEIDAILSVSRPEGAALPLTDFQKLHGYYSELGRAMYGPDIPGDERAAIKSVREDVIGKEMERMAEAENKGDRFAAAQKNWANMENTFYNTDPISKTGSPLAKALAAYDPITKTLRPEFVEDALSGDAEHRIAHRMMAAFNLPTNALDTMKAALDKAKTLPKRAPEIARIPGLKQPPAAPDTASFDPVAWRIGQLKKLAEQFSGASRFEATPTSYGVGRIPFRRGIARALANPTFRDWLSRNPVAAKSLLNPALYNVIFAARPTTQEDQK